ncbi:MAG: DUF4062 domain-containing protein [Flavobacterium sp.]|uniref:DUF4062 domain-containing protein n=1 Tax=Flavobacterium sp. TaxID=239 RepID=UPI0022BE930A|nr:DUF4062 domain-containing protein [Flavobacterium sp.]MCZ8297752.1 DUF4062 domain-containing protein [Flavobacterium sp.]
MPKKKLKIWLSATSLSSNDLGQISAILSKNYEIVYSNHLIAKAAYDFKLENHLEELKKCNLFLGLINPKLVNLSIAVDNIYLEEVKEAMAIGMPYWYSVHRDVTFTRNLLNDVFLNEKNKIQSKNIYFFDVRTLTIYQEILAQKTSELGYHAPNVFFRLDDLINQFDNTIFNQTVIERLKLMVASTVYGFEDQLSKIVNDISSQNFEVLNSFHGSIKVNPQLSNLDNCVQAAKETDWLIGIVRPYYGTGNISGKNITFEEIKTAIGGNKPRWFFIHRDVTFTADILDSIVLNRKGKESKEINELKNNRHIDQKAIDLYNFVIKNHETDLELRNGNWAQEFFKMSEALIYIQSQFLDFDFINNLINPQNDGR